MLTVLKYIIHFKAKCILKMLDHNFNSMFNDIEKRPET